jgi:hypothetical protein
MLSVTLRTEADFGAPKRRSTSSFDSRSWGIPKAYVTWTVGVVEIPEGTSGS